MVRPRPEDKVPLPALSTRPSGIRTTLFRGQPHARVDDRGFDPASLRRAIAAYFGLVSFYRPQWRAGLMARRRLRPDLASDTLGSFRPIMRQSRHPRALGKSNILGADRGADAAVRPGVPEGFVCHEAGVAESLCSPT